jgi:hypothetical protein
MRTWIVSNQIKNVVIVGVAYSFSLLFVGVTPVTLEEAPTIPSPYIEATNPPIVIGEDLQRSIRFQKLLYEWRRERGATSSITQMAQCDSYVAIMSMGKPVIPLIMSQLRSEGDQPDQWFWALQVLTEHDPVSEADRGDTGRMASAWLTWWSENSDYAG